eukprot:61314-Pyramimonas_sp.AAC.1
MELWPAAAAHFDLQAGAVAAIDRLWCSWPSWMMAQVYSRARVAGTPEELCRGKVSDHASLVVSFVTPQESHGNSMCPPRRLERHEVLMQEASRVARNLLAVKQPRDPRTPLLLARALERAARP